MGLTFRVERAAAPDKQYGPLSAHYGWAHLHAFERLLAGEERIDLAAMAGYGGPRGWDLVETPLKPLLDGRLAVEGRVSASDCELVRHRLREIEESWSQGVFAGGADTEMKQDQVNTLRQLLAVLSACVASGRALTVDE